MLAQKDETEFDPFLFNFQGEQEILDPQNHIGLQCRVGKTACKIQVPFFFF